MATENLVVEQRNVQTACFDVESRVLVIPQLDKNISGHLYDLFVGHEVGHALYTPLDGLKKAHDMKIPSAVVNLVEDSRIERKIKAKYPGIRSSFVKGYKELLDKDFFGTQGVDLNTLPFLDRMNMFCKGGPAQGIRFSEFEKKLVDMAESTETYDDVIEVALEIAKYAKQEKEEKRQRMLEEGVMDEEEEFDEYEFDDESDDGEFGLNDDFEGEDGEESETDPSENGTGENDDDSSEEDTSPSGTSSGSEGQTDEIRSVTDDNYKRNESKLFAQDADGYYYGNIPKVNLDEVILDHKELYKRFKEEMSQRGITLVQDRGLKQYQKIRQEANKVVSYMAREFEMRKNADQLKRASTAKTGDLNMSKIYSYQFNEDIFKKITVLPGGKSHGLVMFIDWSGSMSNHLENTMKQLISLVLFCKKVNIPYEVYAFTQEYDTVSPQPKLGDVEMRQFRLLNILSSRMSSMEFTYAASTLVDTSTSKYAYSCIFAMGGTPLNEAIISAMEIVPAFQKKYKLQVVNTVFLTDGEGHRLDRVYADYNGTLSGIVGNKSEDYWNKSRPRLILRDPITKHQVMVEEYSCQKNTAAYLELLKLRTNCNLLGFYVLSGREFSRAAYILLPRAANYDEMRVKFRKEKSLVITSAGFDEYYMLRSEALDTEEDATFEVKENATTRGLVSAFSKYAGNRLANRVVLNRFIGMIS